MPVQTRVSGDKTFDAIGYGGMGLPVGYGSVGSDEEFLKVAFLFPIAVTGGQLTHVLTAGSGYCL